MSPLDLLFPPRCLLCGELLREPGDLCGKCRKQAPWCRNRKTKPQFLDSITAVWYYKGNVRASLLRFKFGHKPHLARGYGRYLGAVLQKAHPEGFDVVTWVPTAFWRRFRRGYDQARLVAEALSPTLSQKPRRLLRKIRNNPAQSGLSDPAMRRANVMGVYRLAGRQDLRGKRVLLVDDIFTTGATAGECARILRAAGAREVHCAAVALAGQKESHPNTPSSVS